MEKQLVLVILRENLFDKKKAKDAILGSHFETDTCRADLTIMLLSLFVSWERFLDLFYTAEATITIYKEFAWSVWK